MIEKYYDKYDELLGPVHHTQNLFTNYNCAFDLYNIY